VLQVGSGFRHLWQFSTRNNQVNLTGQRKIGTHEPLPAKTVAKDWTTIFQGKLNIAWLPADQVFLRVVHLPAADSQELLSMIELQLEKLSPLPVAQVVWSMETLPKQAENLQSVIVLIVSRSTVEEFLGQLEGAGYLADRLEVPCLHQLLDTQVESDGVWIYPTVQAGGNLCLVAWWCNGLLQQLQLIHLPEGDGRVALVVEQLTKTAWAGEVEGWLNPPVHCHLVADSTTAPLWENGLRQWAGEPVAITEPLPEAKLGELAARRASRGEAKANLLPPEYSARYQQQLVDRLWMGGLGALLALYVLGVLIYFGAVGFLTYKLGQVENRAATISTEYTNAVRLKERIDVLQNQLNLKYAALDCFKAVSEKLPADLTLVSFDFQGQKLRLQGTAPSDQTTQINDYNEDLRKVKVDGKPLFKQVSGPHWVNRAALGGGQNLAWDFSCELNQREAE
jgi:Tfp pilus assembly protein PilN